MPLGTYIISMIFLPLESYVKTCKFFDWVQLLLAFFLQLKLCRNIVFASNRVPVEYEEMEINKKDAGACPFLKNFAVG